MSQMNMIQALNSALDVMLERCFYHLKSPIERVTGWDTPYPHAFEWDYFPGPARLISALQRVMEN